MRAYEVGELGCCGAGVVGRLGFQPSGRLRATQRQIEQFKAEVVLKLMGILTSSLRQLNKVI
jgi:hypothetical protein